MPSDAGATDLMLASRIGRSLTHNAVDVRHSQPLSKKYMTDHLREDHGRRRREPATNDYEPSQRAMLLMEHHHLGENAMGNINL
jgi:hypothetical protein